MQREIILTRDGSASISIPAMNVTYHSHHGAMQESLHIFIEAGLRHYNCPTPKEKVAILEVGFGTGLNALLTQIEATETNQTIYYTAIELFPLIQKEWEQLNYTKLLQESSQKIFEQLHIAPWEKEVAISNFFYLHKAQADLLHFFPSRLFDIIYFDAFAPAAQPELWTTAVFSQLAKFMSAQGILVTYCSKGVVRRSMQAAGFSIEKIPGPPGKREMVRATKM